MKYSKVIKIFLIITILALGAFLRFENLDRQPYWMDEGYTVNAVISGIQNGFTKTGAAILDSGENYSCPMYCLPTAVIAKYTENNTTSFRILAAIFGFLFIFVIYFFARTFFKEKNENVIPAQAGIQNNTAKHRIPTFAGMTPFLVAFFIAFSYYQIAWSRQARWYTEFEVFFWLALLFFYIVIARKRSDEAIPMSSQKTSGLLRFARNDSIYLALSVLFTILAILTHKLAVLLPFIFIIWFIIEKKQKISKKSIIYYLSFIIVLLLIPFVIAPNFFLNAIHNINWSYNLPYYLSFYLRNYWPFILVSIYGFFSANKEEKKKHLMLWSAFFVYLIPLSFLTNIVHYRYMFHLMPIFFLAAVLSFFNVIPAKAGIQATGTKRWIPAFAGMTLIVLFFLTGEGIIFPKNFYNLESDDPAKLPGRPYYAYTPQPDWNKAYAFIKLDSRLESIPNTRDGNDMVVISSHPHFNKIFLDQAGYWIGYDYLGFEKDLSEPLENNTEYYVNAQIINNLEELKKITAEKHGYLVFDYQSADGRINQDILNYIQKNLTLSFYDKINSYSQIWVYKF